jgi:hypothetical protein
MSDLVCRKCKQPKTPNDFYEGVKSRCKECHKTAVAARYRETGGRVEYEKEREKSPERKEFKKRALQDHRAKNPLKYKARTAVGNAVRDGRLIKGPCEVCGTTKRVQAHHHDYSKPLDVRWLCFQHHREDEHQQTIRTEELRAQ